MNLVSQSLNGVTLALVGIKILSFVGIGLQVVEFVLVFVAKTKLPTVWRDKGSRRFGERLLDLVFARELGVLVYFFFSRRPLDEDRLGRHRLAANQCGSAFSDALWIRRFTKEIEHGRRKIDVADGLGDVK